MNFLEWLYSTYPNPTVNGEWGALHIAVLALCVAFIVASTLLLKNKSQRSRFTVLAIIAAIIFLFGVVRRIVGFINLTDATFDRVLSILLPRPGCAISCWLVILAVIINKRYFYNFASIISILCGTVFFAYPGAGFNNEYILFENLYSIVTHAGFYVMAICFITYKFADFEYKAAWREGICLAALTVYAFLEIYVIKINSDPFYFMPKNEIMEILGDMSYGLYLPLYLVFVALFVFAFYFISYLVKRKKA